MVESQPGMVGGSKKSSNWLVILLVEAFDLSDGNAAASCIADALPINLVTILTSCGRAHVSTCNGQAWLVSSNH